VNAGKSQQIFHKRRLKGSWAVQATAARAEKSRQTSSENFHRFVRLYNSLVALPECDAEITGLIAS